MPETTAYGNSYSADESSLTQTGNTFAFKQTLSAKGDLLTHTGSAYAKQAASSVIGNVLTANSGATNGVEYRRGWTQIAGAALTNTTGTTTLVNDSSIPTNYFAVKFLLNANASAAAAACLLRINNDSTGHYLNRYFSATATLAFESTGTGINLGNGSVAGIQNSCELLMYTKAVGATGTNAYGGWAHDFANFSNSIISGSVQTAADLTRLDLVLGSVVMNGYWSLLALPFPV